MDVAGATSFCAPTPAGPYPSATLTSATHTSRTSAASEGRTPDTAVDASSVSDRPVPSGLGSRNARANRHHGQGGSLRYPPWVCVRSHSVSVSLMSACGAPYVSGTTPSAGGGGAVRGSRGGRSAIASLAFSICDRGLLVLMGTPAAARLAFSRSRCAARCAARAALDRARLSATASSFRVLASTEARSTTHAGRASRSPGTNPPLLRKPSICAATNAASSITMRRVYRNGVCSAVRSAASPAARIAGPVAPSSLAAFSASALAASLAATFAACAPRNLGSSRSPSTTSHAAIASSAASHERSKSTRRASATARTRRVRRWIPAKVRRYAGEGLPSLYHARRVTSHTHGGSAYDTVQSSTSESLSGCGGLSSGVMAFEPERTSWGRSCSPPTTLRALPKTTTLAIRLVSSPTILPSSRLSLISKSASGRIGAGDRSVSGPRILGGKAARSRVQPGKRRGYTRCGVGSARARRARAPSRSRSDNVVPGTSGNLI